MELLNRMYIGARVFSALRNPVLILSAVGITIGCMETPTRTPSSESEAGLATAAEVAGLPVITQQPGFQSATVGYTISFTVAATSTTPLTYQWFSKPVDGVPTPIPGATEPSYSKAAHLPDSGARFSCEVTNATGTVSSAAPEASVGRIELQGEKAILTGVDVSATNPGYTASGYAAFQLSSGNSIQWNITMRRAGTYPMVFRYANGSNTTVLANVVINGKTYAKNLPFPPTGGWDMWSTATYDQGYTTGSRKIVLTVNTAVGLNLDRLTIE